MKLIYPAIFHHEDDSYWVEFPDLPGCQTYADTVKDALLSAQEALAGYCIVMLEEKKPLPAASNMANLDIPEGCFPSLVDTDISHYLNREKAVKKTLTIPSWLNDLATERNIKFSETLQDALMAKLNLTATAAP